MRGFGLAEFGIAPLHGQGADDAALIHQGHGTKAIALASRQLIMRQHNVRPAGFGFGENDTNALLSRFFHSGCHQAGRFLPGMHLGDIRGSNHLHAALFLPAQAGTVAFQAVGQLLGQRHGGLGKPLAPQQLGLKLQHPRYGNRRTQKRAVARPFLPTLHPIAQD